MKRNDYKVIGFLIFSLLLFFLIPSLEISGVLKGIILFTGIIVGFGTLITGGDSLVKGGGSIAKKYNIPPIVIGLTIISLGSSAPEFFINVLASFKGETQLLISNIIGSNISNLLLVLGVSAIIYHLGVQKNTLRKEIPFSLLAVVVLLIFLNDVFINGSSASENLLVRSEGLVLLFFFVIFMFYVFSLIKQNQEEDENSKNIKEYSVLRSIFYVTIGGGLLYVGGELVVGNSVKLADMFGVSKTLIGVTVVALGTSLPELAAGVMAAVKKQGEMVIGNVIGSNIFNIFWIGGTAATISSIEYNEQLNIDLLLLVISTIVVLISVYTGKKISRKEGILFVIIYAFYLIYVIFRG